MKALFSFHIISKRYVCSVTKSFGYPLPNEKSHEIVKSIITHLIDSLRRRAVRQKTKKKQKEEEKFPEENDAARITGDYFSLSQRGPSFDLLFASLPEIVVHYQSL